MHILYYITSHGYGHAVRSAAVCNALFEAVGACDRPANVGADIDRDGLRLRLTVCTDIPQAFFKEELPFPHNWRAGGFDVGCLQSDGVSVLMKETLAAYKEISVNNRLRLDEEVRWCKFNNVDCVISDITPFAFDVAHKAGIPSVAISNFTWHDIYSPYVERFPEYGEMLAEMADQYRKASIALTLHPSLPMPVFERKKPIHILGRRGVDRREEICRHFGIDRGKRLGVIYVGNFGLDRVDWRRLEKFDGWEFVGVYPLPGNPNNYHLVAKEQFRYQDLSASADAVIAKMGYGVFSESILNGIPLVYLPREDFAEFPVLDAEAERLGSGVCVDTEEFCGLGWLKVLNGIVDNNNMTPDNCGGALMCADEIIKIAEKQDIKRIITDLLMALSTIFVWC
ncbi:MAG: hypothetical protein LBC59_10040 [Chitinispirillales bacterium]|jgi:hypothetical protein|nr:hypothetical protein [Chitinispirillales bacterium]